MAFSALSMLVAAATSKGMDTVDKIYGGQTVVGTKDPKRMKKLYLIIAVSGVYALGSGHYIWGGIILGEFCLLVAFWKTVFYGRY